jgi:hypothetical protein
VTPEKRAIVSYGTGVRASLTHVTPRLIGGDIVTLYSAGWEEWGQDPETKVEGSEPQPSKTPMPGPCGRGRSATSKSSEPIDGSSNQRV